MNLLNKFREFENIFNDQKNIADKLFNLLPKELKQVKIFKDQLANRYLYSFGNPLNINSCPVHCFGGNQNHEIKTLYLALRLAYKYLDDQKLNSFITSIKNIDKHQDFLFEMRPLLNLRADLKPQYESNDNCCGNKNIDWKIQGGDYEILFDVKNRIKGTVNFLSYVREILQKSKDGVSEDFSSITAPNPADLFKSTFTKFNKRTNNKVLQGVWILTMIKENEIELNEYFANLDSKKIQFAIISGWDKKAYILAKNHEYKQVLMNYFNIIESKDFVCSNYPGNKNRV